METEAELQRLDLVRRDLEREKMQRMAQKELMQKERNEAMYALQNYNNVHSI